MQGVLEARVSASRINATRTLLLPQARPRNFLGAFVCLVALYCWWVSSLPVFPTQDGGVHLYYVDVIRYVLSGSRSFGAFYFIRHPLPPYVVHYAILLALTKFFSAAVAEKCVVCMIIVLTTFGFRFLAQSVGTNGGVTSLWIIPLALSWPLFMGFHNYCLSLGFSLWAWGTWLRARRRHKPALWCLFLLLVAMILFTHPVPLVFLIVVITADLLMRLVQQKLRTDSTYGEVFSRYKSELIAAAFTYASLLYVALFVEKASTAHDLASHASRLGAVSALVRLRWMSFATGGLYMQLYRCALAALLLLGFAIAARNFRKRWRMRRLDNSEIMLVCALGFALLLPLLPPNLNGSEHFSNRLPVLLWIIILAAASADGKLATRFRTAAAGLACAFALVTLGLANHFIRPVANEISLIERAPVGQHKIGLLFDAPVKITNDRLTFEPYLRWAGGRYFRRAGAVMLNDPWVSPPYPLPLRRSPNALTAEFSSSDFEDPGSLHASLMNSAERRSALLSSVDLMLFVGKSKPGSSAPDPLIALDLAHRWNCTQNIWYFVCEANSNSSAARTEPRGW